MPEKTVLGLFRWDEALNLMGATVIS